MANGWWRAKALPLVDGNMLHGLVAVQRIFLMGEVGGEWLELWMEKSA